MTVAGAHEMAVGTTPGAAAPGKLRIYPSSVDGAWHQVNESNVDTVISGAIGPGYAGTSTTSLTIGLGSATFTTQAGLAYVVGSRARIASDADPADFMEGLVTAYSGTSMTIDVDAIGGTGTDADWNLSIAGEQGPDGAGVPPTVVAHGSMGATETFDYGDGPAHEGTLDADLTVTLTGAVAGECIMSIGFTEDGTGGWTVTLPGSVSNAAEIEAAIDTTPAAYNLIVLRTVDSGTTWYGLRVAPGPTGATGGFGGAIAIDYTISTTTTDSDPGAGNLRLDNATQDAATTIRADLADVHGTTWTAVLDTLADASNAVKGHIRLVKTDDLTKWLLFTVSAVATPSGYRNITVAIVGSSASSPFANADPVTLLFSRSGDQGSTVGSGTVTTVEELDGSPTDSAVTKIVFPNGTLVIAAHVATYTPAAAVRCILRASANQTVNNGPVLFDTEITDPLGLHDTSTNKGRITVDRDGTYLFMGNVYDTTGACEIKWWVNGTQQTGGQDRVTAANVSTGASTILDLAAGDYVEMRLDTAGGNHTILGGSGDGAHTTLRMARVVG